MGLISRVLSFTRIVGNSANVSDVKADPGGGPNITMGHFAPAGDDSFPIDTDYVVSVGVPGSGRQAAVGYADPLNTPKALKGDKRIYARKADGSVGVDLWLHADGTGRLENYNGSVTLAPDGTLTLLNSNGSYTVGADGSQTGANGAGSFGLLANGDFVANGAVISAAGAVTDASGKTLGTHAHPQDSDSNGDTQQDTGGPL